MCSTKKLLSLVLSLVMVLSLFSGCGNLIAPNENTGITEPDGTSTPNAENFPIVQEFESWLTGTLAQLGYPIKTVFGKDIESRMPEFSLFFGENEENTPPELRIGMDLDVTSGEIKRIDFRTCETTTEDILEAYRKLGAEMVSYFYDDSVRADAELVLGLTVDDEVYVQAKNYEHPFLYVYEDGDSFTIDYDRPYYIFRSFGPLSPDAQRTLCIYPSVRADSPNAKEFEEAVNTALSQAGYPIEITLWRNYEYEHFENWEDFSFTVNHIGSGEDVYSGRLTGRLVYEDHMLSQFIFETYGTSSLEMKDAAAAVYSAVAPLFSSDLTEEFMSAFFGLEDNAHEILVVCNEFGAEVSTYCYQDEQTLTMDYEENGLDLTFDINENNEKISKINGSIFFRTEEEAEHATRTLDLADFVNSLPIYLIDYDDIGDMLRASFADKTGMEYPFTVQFWYRPGDHAIESIGVKYNPEWAGYGQELKGELAMKSFQRATAVLAAHCGSDLTEKDVLDMYAQLAHPEYLMYMPVPWITRSSEDGSVQLEIQKADRTWQFTIKLEPEPLTGVGNFFVDQKLVPSPSVQNGEFSFIYPGYSIFYDYLWYYLNEKGLPMSVYTSQLETEHMTFMEEELGFLDYYTGEEYEEYFALDKGMYSLFTNYYSGRFELTYNGNPSKRLGLDDGYYYKYSDPETVLHFPISLSLLCDSGMTDEEARQLFTHTVEANVTLEDGRTVTLYAPRDVAHILVSDPQTGDNQYYALTKVDFEGSYGSLDAFVSRQLNT